MLMIFQGGILRWTRADTVVVQATGFAIPFHFQSNGDNR